MNGDDWYKPKPSPPPPREPKPRERVWRIFKAGREYDCSFIFTR
jgi:hypothetical protein